MLLCVVVCVACLLRLVGFCLFRVVVSVAKKTCLFVVVVFVV